MRKLGKSFTVTEQHLLLKLSFCGPMQNVWTTGLDGLKQALCMLHID